MQETDDSALLRQYTENNSEEAFAALVTRHVNLVYSVALRQVGNTHHAEEITQAAFIILAKKAGQLRHDKALSSWLFQATRLTANNFVRSEMRRQRREQEAHMQSILNEPENEIWPRIAPLLDAAVAGLREKDRNAIVLRFYEGKNLRDIGTALGVSEDAAEKRLKRAVEKLQKFFLKRGVTSTTATLAGAISANSVQAAPAMLAKAVTATAIAKGATASASTLTLIKGALKIMAWTKAKTAIVVGAAIILAAGTTTTLVIQHQYRNDYPRSLWANAGYADPASALETYFWASSQGDGKTILASISSGFQDFEKGNYGDVLQKLNMPLDQFISQYVSHDVDGITGFRILQSEPMSEGEVHLHLSIAGKSGEQVFVMKKIGNEWKVDDEPAHWDAPMARQLLQQHPELVPK